MSVARKAVYIVGAKRTPFGAFGGKLKTLSSTELAFRSAQSAIAQAGIDASKIDETFYGNVIASSLDAAYLSRHVHIRVGAPVEKPAMNINRLCGSGFETVCLGTEAIEQGRANITLCGGAENMSQTPFHIDGLAARWGTALGKDISAKDALWAGLTDSLIKTPMGLTAEKLGSLYGITREQCDEFALRSQNLTQAATEAGHFDAEIVPIEIKGKKGPESMTTDEHPRKNCTLADLQKLKPVFKEDGLVTAGSASGICDGAASLILASEESVKAENLKPIARVVAWHRVGCDPSIMGAGPIESIKGALKAANLTLNDMDFIEINEAFGAQYLACEKALGFDREKANTSGGAIALGHPLGASGSRILAHLAHKLQRTGKKYAIGSACIGGGQGIAVIIENTTI